MFHPGDMIIYGRTGVCRVEKIEERDNRQYYCLQALYQTCIIHAPVNGKILMRPVLSREEADRLIDSIPTVIANPVECHVLRELTNHYLDSLNTCDASELLAMTPMLPEGRCPCCLRTAPRLVGASSISLTPARSARARSFRCASAPRKVLRLFGGPVYPLKGTLQGCRCPTPLQCCNLTAAARPATARTIGCRSAYRASQRRLVRR